jgi:hypothetical protein
LLFPIWLFPSIFILSLLGKDQDQIAFELNVHRNTIGNFLKKNGLNKKTRYCEYNSTKIFDVNNVLF